MATRKRTKHPNRKVVTLGASGGDVLAERTLGRWDRISIRYGDEAWDITLHDDGTMEVRASSAPRALAVRPVASNVVTIRQERL